MTMSETVKLSLTAYFGERRDFRPRNLQFPFAAPADDAEDPYARGLADGQQMAQAAFTIERKQLQDLLAAKIMPKLTSYSTISSVASSPKLSATCQSIALF